MKFIILLVTASFLLASCNKSEPKLETLESKASYLIGHDMGSQISKALPNNDKEALLYGVLSGIENKAKVFTDDEAKKIVADFISKNQSAANPDNPNAAEAEANLAKGREYLAKLATEEGIIKTEEGILYKVITSGAKDGASPAADQTVKVHYEGRLIDGSVFDSSYARGTAAQFQLNRVIRGWTLILQKMKVGDVWEVTIPSELSYGSRGNSSIPANSVLIFKIELMAIKPAEAAAAPKPAK